jgi:hypothetical protein
MEILENTKNQSFKTLGLLNADSADFSDIQDTRFVGSLEKMGTREAQKWASLFLYSRVLIAPKAQPWDPRAAGFPAIRESRPGHPVNPV